MINVCITLQSKFNNQRSKIVIKFEQRIITSHNAINIPMRLSYIDEQKFMNDKMEIIKQQCIDNVAELCDDEFIVSLIPYTFSHTIFQYANIDSILKDKSLLIFPNSSVVSYGEPTNNF